MTNLKTDPAVVSDSQRQVTSDWYPVGDFRVAFRVRGDGVLQKFWSPNQPAQRAMVQAQMRHELQAAEREFIRRMNAPPPRKPLHW